MWQRVHDLARAFARGLTDLLYPPACIFCTAPLTPDPDDFPDRSFCSPCLASLMDSPHEPCPRCASPIGPYALVEGGCARCRPIPFHFERAIAFGVYDGLLRDVV